MQCGTRFLSFNSRRQITITPLPKSCMLLDDLSRMFSHNEKGQFILYIGRKSVCVNECCCFSIASQNQSHELWRDFSSSLGGMLRREMKMKSEKKWKPLNVAHAHTSTDTHSTYFFSARVHRHRLIFHANYEENLPSKIDETTQNCRFVPAIAYAHATQSQIFTHGKLSFRNFAANWINSPAPILLSPPTRILIELFVSMETAHWKFLFTLIASFACVKCLNARKFQFLLNSFERTLLFMSGAEIFRRKILFSWENLRRKWLVKFDGKMFGNLNKRIRGETFPINYKRTHNNYV